MQEDEVLFEKIDEDAMTIDIASISLNQATSHNIIVLNEKLFGEES